MATYTANLAAFLTVSRMQVINMIEVCGFFLKLLKTSVLFRSAKIPVLDWVGLYRYRIQHRHWVLRCKLLCADDDALMQMKGSTVDLKPKANIISNANKYLNCCHIMGENV